MAIEILLDVHQLQPPEPMEQAIDALNKLKPGEYIRMIHRMQPFPLYNLLMENGFKHRAVNGKISAFDIYIWKANDKASAQAVEKILEKDQD